MTYTPADIQWRDLELEQTVEYLNAVNPHGYTAASIKAHAVRSWTDNDFAPTFVGTAGWYVTIIPTPDGSKPFLALVSIMAYTALTCLSERRAA
ncbi:hypothetical protein JYP52_01275 [Nitratireductor aquibiodomus]|uniref:hypothetical protein n=1 Tax=Nitratireductor aquibiodomus TaxID=204799 RepID=UPI0019D40ADE|nr:hypothetical protein [Nitratireductor aquibiodomus]MBN7759753.1 hypothetical protein [Nitratireductor aquibiodomus]